MRGVVYSRREPFALRVRLMKAVSVITSNPATNNRIKPRHYLDDLNANAIRELGNNWGDFVFGGAEGVGVFG